jgi:glucoamylase
MLDYKVAKIGLLGSLLAAHGALSAPPHVPRQANNSLDEWLDTQEPIALEGVLANIGGQGSKVEGAADGLVVASPSKSDPDCEMPTMRLP